MIKYEQRKGLLARDWNRWERRCAPLLNLLGLHFATDGYLPVHRGPSRDFLAWGYFQGEAYFADYADTIRAELRAKVAPAGPLAEEIRAAAFRWPCICAGGTTASRKTPFSRFAPRPTTPGPPPPRRPPIPKQRSLSFRMIRTGQRKISTPPACPLSLCPGGEAVADMNLMALCRGFVLSNSTYSWWAQYLAGAGRTVWAPDRWYAHTKETALYQPRWQLIQTR